MNTTLRNVTPGSLDMDRVAQVGSKVRSLIEEMRIIFPERGAVLEQIKYALMTRHHVLQYGTYGTGKSDLLMTLFSSIEGANIQSISFNKFMSESAVVGLPDPKKLRDDGRIFYDRESGILDAHFLELDEFLDANGPLLRTLLGILNERLFKRGRQLEKAKLFTAVASTNADPFELIKRDPSLGAVIDRFIFQTRVEYLTETDSRIRMYKKYLAGETPATKISLGDLEYISDIVLSANQITDENFIALYEKIVEAFCQKLKGKRVISDRRKCRVLQIIEAEALLYGRYDVHPEDINAVRWGLCAGHEQEAMEMFQLTAKPFIEEAKAAKAQNLDAANIALIQQLEKRIPKIDPASTAEQLAAMARDLTQLLKDLSDVRPQLPSTVEQLKKVVTESEKAKTKVLELITGS